jgi:RNA polymerase sigma-70 factor (ECF subfamily)
MVSGFRESGRLTVMSFRHGDRSIMGDRIGENQAADAEGWVDRHGDHLYRYALLRLRSPDRAADVVQETFLAALNAQGSFEARSSERTWLIGILRHKIIDHFRKSGHEQVVVNGVALEALDESAFDGRGHWKIGPVSWRGDPLRDIETREFWEIFHGCLAKLPSGLADAFYLREVEGLGAEEVQRILGITPANLWARLHRARSLLRKSLEIEWFGRSPSPPNDTKGRSRS